MELIENKQMIGRERRASGISSDETPMVTVVGAEADHDGDLSVGIQGTTASLSAGLHDLGLQKERTRLSGAQQRRLNRERKIAAGTWTQHKPGRKNRQMNLMENKPILGMERGWGTSSYETPMVTVVGAEADHDSDFSAGSQSAGSHDLGPQKERTRLSGAQLRRLNRERKMAAGTWTQHKPGRKNRQERGNVGAQSRRPCDYPKTPWQPFMQSRSSKPTGTHSEVGSELRMAIIDRRHPDIMLDPAQADMIKEYIVEALDRTPSGSGNPLQFSRTSFSRGVLWMTCANEGTKQWLGEIIGTLDNLWEGADLTVVMSKDLPVRPRVLVFIPGPEEEEEAVRARLGRQNPGLSVENWLLLSRNIESGGVFLAYSLDAPSFGVLTKNQNVAYYKLGKVHFRILKGAD